MLKKILIPLLCCATLIGCSKQENNQPLGNPVEYHLSNGMQLVVKVDKRAPIAVVQLWYKVGSLDEPNGVTGIAHATEHMMFQGSKKYPGNSYATLVSANGGSFNAQTSYDYTMFYQTISADKLQLAIELEADRMQDLTLSAKSFASEIQVVKEERRMRTDDDPQGTLLERFFATAFISSPYHHAPIGWMKDLNAMTVQDIRKWHSDWYVPNNAILVVAGDVNPKQVYDYTEKYFGDIPSHPLPEIKPQTDESPMGLRTVEVDMPANLPWLVMGFTVPTVPSETSTTQKWQPYALDLLQQVLTGSDSSILEQQLVRSQGIATNIDISYEPYRKLNTLFTIFALPAAGHTSVEVQTAITNILNHLATTPISAQELAIAKTQLLAQLIFNEDDQTQEASDIGQVMVVGLPWTEVANYKKQIQMITAAQLQQVAKEYLISQRETVGYLVPI